MEVVHIPNISLNCHFHIPKGEPKGIFSMKIVWIYYMHGFCDANMTPLVYGFTILHYYHGDISKLVRQFLVRRTRRESS